MTDKEIIIDGVNVAGCRLYKQAFTGFICADPNMYNDCSRNSNCMYKQLCRKEQECEKLKKALKNYRLEPSEKIDFDRYKQALEKIEETITEINGIIIDKQVNINPAVIEWKNLYMKKFKQISTIINEVKND